VFLRLFSGAAFALAIFFLAGEAVNAQAAATPSPQPTPAVVTPPPAAATPTPFPSPSAVPSAIPSPTAIPYVVPTSAPFARINLNADTINFYFNRYIIEAIGGVRVAMDDGAVVSGDFFSIDLRTNHFIVAGHVHISAKGAQYDGAAFSEYIDTGRGYFLPILSEPDHWTFIAGNYALPYLGREIPGFVFQFPDTSRDVPFLSAKSAVIWPRDAMLFNDTKVHVLGFNAPGGRIYLNFSSNLNFHQNSLVGAIGDVGYPFWGTRWSYSTLHLRYDYGIGPYLGFEQHFAWDNAYIVASYSPFDRANKQINLMASDRTSPNFELDTFQQLNLVQYGWTTPQSAAYFGSYSSTVAFRESFAKLTYNIWNYGLSVAPGTTFDPDHPTNTTLVWNGFDHRIFQLPLKYRLRSGVSNADDTYGVGTFNGTPYTNLWSTFYGGTLYTDSIKLTKNDYLTASYDRQRTFFSLPHFVDTATTTASISRLFGTKAAFSVTYQNINSGDYAGAQQLALYPPGNIPDPVTGAIVYGYNAFSGFATSRTMSYLLAYTPKPNLSLSLNYQHYTDFPRPIGLVEGRPPNYFDIDAKMRLTPQLSLELGRAYYFNWYGAKWAPQMVIQFGP
jgi:hypothetical protein